MIIYGWKSTLLGGQHMAGNCAACGMANSVQIGVAQKYAHIFWIPLLPIGKTGFSHCPNCKQTLKYDEMPAAYKAELESIKPMFKTPWWTYTGLVLILGVIFWAKISSGHDASENQKMIENPQKGDVYTLKLGEKQYTLMKVHEVKGDTAYLYMNQYVGKSLLSTVSIAGKGDTAYLQIPIGLSKADLKAKLASGEITTIVR